MSEAVKAELPPRVYEVIYILRPNIDREASERLAQRVADIIVREGGTLTLVENWGRRPMAYEIEHHKRGIYVYINFLGNGALVSELERNFRLIDEVIRFQTVKIADQSDSVEVDAELIKFEAVEPAGEDEEDRTLEQELGLVQPPRAPRPEAREESTDEKSEGAEAAEGEEKAEEGAEAPAKAEAAPAKAEAAPAKAEAAPAEEKTEGDDK